jgi:hypothetical protein
MSKCVAEFSRLAVPSKGGDAKVRIYEADNGFVPTFYNDEGYVNAGIAGTYAAAVKVAIEWLDNSDFYQ